ncbi:MAG: polysaccharide deacetylase, partial [Candidatus Angelobacter sp.]
MLFNVLGAVITGLVIFFIVTVVFQSETLPPLLMPQQKKNLKALKQRERRKKTPVRGSHRKTGARPSEVELNADEGIRAAYYVTWDAASFVSLKEYYPQIDILFPEWLHVLSPDGLLRGVDETNRFFPIVQNGHVHPTDTRVMSFLRTEKANVDVFPLINNYDTVAKTWQNIGDFLNDPGARKNFRSQLLLYLASDRFKGASIDFEEIPLTAQPGFLALIDELGRDLHARNLKLYINVPVSDRDFDYARLAASSDGLVIMNYDQHQTTSGPGPIAAQNWFISNVKQALKDIPKNKIICSIGNYGYDWSLRGRNRRVLKVDTDSVQAQWLHAFESEADIDLDSDSLNPHFGYVEDNGVEHQVWFLDAVTAFNEMRAARELGLRTFALWRLGSEDRSLWAIWDNPSEEKAEQKLQAVPAGEDVDREGYGDILYIDHQPKPG